MPVSWDAGNELFCRYSTCTNLVAKGSANLPLDYSAGLFGGSSYAYLSVDFGGATIGSDFDPSQFINPSSPTSRKYLALADPGLHDDSLLDIFQIGNGGFVRDANSLFHCTYSNAGCDRSNYILTYTYAPGGVPEPATWAMMLLGFGAMGRALRRRHKVTARVRFA